MRDSFDEGCKIHECPCRTEQGIGPCMGLERSTRVATVRVLFCCLAIFSLTVLTHWLTSIPGTRFQASLMVCGVADARLPQVLQGIFVLVNKSLILGASKLGSNAVVGGRPKKRLQPPLLSPTPWLHSVKELMLSEALSSRTSEGSLARPLVRYK